MLITSIPFVWYNVVSEAISRPVVENPVIRTNRAGVFEFMVPTIRGDIGVVFYYGLVEHLSPTWSDQRGFITICPCAVFPTLLSVF